MFTFLYVTNHTKALTFERTLDFHKNLARQNSFGFEELNKTKKKILIVNKPEEDKDQSVNM